MDIKIGIGYDIHRLKPGRRMVLGGVHMDFIKGPEGHSDGDVLLHAVCDAILGALGKEDIGFRYPDTDPEYKNISSAELLKDTAGLIREEAFEIMNIDSVVILEEPKVGPYRERIIENISGILGVSKQKINVKAKTSEKTGAVGEGSAVEAQAVVLLRRKN
ncbi:MAG: 2-C-methyl-D-erythritol 2,4-cyclodiphosphate synthase [Candidatus Omnitrophota bacterium]